MSIRSVGFRLSIIDETLTFESFVHRCNIDEKLFNEYVFFCIEMYWGIFTRWFCEGWMPLHTNGMFTRGSQMFSELDIVKVVIWLKYKIVVDDIYGDKIIKQNLVRSILEDYKYHFKLFANYSNNL